MSQSVAYLQPAELEDHDAPEVDASGCYYRVRRGIEVDLGSSHGKVFRSNLKSLIHSTYQDCFEKFENIDLALLEYIECGTFLFGMANLICQEILDKQEVKSLKSCKGPS